MSRKQTELGKGNEKAGKLVQVRTLEDLVELNLGTLNGVINETIDNKKAGLIFTGSRTVCVALKLGIEAMKLGLRQVGGVEIGDGSRVAESAPQIETVNPQK